MPDTRRDWSSLATLFADNTAGDISPQDGRDLGISCHPEKVHQAAAVASPPSSPLAGDLWFQTDGMGLNRYDGSSWVKRGPLWLLTEPVLSNFPTAINTGSAVTATANGVLNFSCVANSSAYSPKCLFKTAPSTPYVVTTLFSWVFDPSVSGSYALAGLAWRQSSDGKWIMAGTQQSNASGAWRVSKFSNSTTLAADYFSNPLGAISTPAMNWVRIADNGTNRIVSLSPDGFNWTPIHTIGRTDYLTADQVGFFISPYSTAVSMSLYSWKEA